MPDAKDNRLLTRKVLYFWTPLTRWHQPDEVYVVDAGDTANVTRSHQSLLNSIDNRHHVVSLLPRLDDKQSRQRILFPSLALDAAATRFS